MVSVNHVIQGFRPFVLVAGLLAAVSLQAADAPPAGPDALGPKPAMCMGGEGCEGKERMCEKKMKAKHDSIAAELKLDEKQRQLFDEATSKMHSGMQDGMSLHQDMKALVHSNDYSEQKVRELVRKHHAEQEEAMVAAANAMHAFHASLSPEQQEKFKAMKSEMREKMKAHMKDRMEGAGDADAAGVKPSSVEPSNAEKPDDDKTGASAAKHPHEH